MIKETFMYTCMFCSPCRFAIFIPGSPVRFCMLILGGIPVILAMLILAIPDGG